MESKDGALLEKIFEMTDIEIFSDIKYPAARPKVLAAVRGIPLIGYSLEQWGYAFTYISGKNIGFRSFDELESFVSQAQGKTSW